jgi:hypothetical protein
MKRFLLCLAVALPMGCAAVGSNSIQGVLQKSGEYTAEVDGAGDALSIEKIIPQNGPYFVEFGVDSCLTAEVRSGNRSFRVRMLSFLTVKGALGAYTFTGPSGSEALQIGAAGRRDSEAVEFVKGNFLVDVRPGEGADLTGAEELARHLAKNISGPALMPELFAPLPKENLVKGSAFYFKGAKSFATRFTAQLAEDLGVAGAAEGVSGKYTLDRDTTVTLVKLRFSGRKQTMEALSFFIQSRQGMPMSKPNTNRDYYTIFNQDGTEMYIAEFGEWLVFIPDGPHGGKSQNFFEFALRSI